MKKLESILKGFYQGKNLKKQMPIMILGVFMMGFALSWLRLVDMGTDTFTNMNLAISSRIGLSFGNWQMILNTLLFIAVIIWGAEYIGFGTVINMIFVGYICDFFIWVWGFVLPDGFFDSMAVRIIVFILSLLVFVFSAAVYMNSGLGVSPCDAVPFIVQSKIKVLSIKVVRMLYDATLIVIGLLFGSKLYIVSVMMAFTLGPTVEYVGKNLKKWVNPAEEVVEVKLEAELES